MFRPHDAASKWVTYTRTGMDENGFARGETPSTVSSAQISECSHPIPKVLLFMWAGRFPFVEIWSVPCRPHSHWCQTLPGLWPRPRHPTHPHWHPHRERNAQLPLRGVQDKTVKMLQHPLFAWRRFETGKIELQKLVYIQGRASSASIKWNIAIIHNTSDYQFSIN